MNYSSEIIADALTYISADCTREEWARMAMAIKSELGDDGFFVFNQWSETGASYKPDSAKKTYESVGESGGVKIGTLIMEAQKGGFNLNNVERKQLTDADYQAQRERVEQQQKEAAERKKSEQGEAARLASEIWESAEPLTRHAYLSKKKCIGYGLRVGMFNGKRSLLVPIMNAGGKIRSLQAISDSGFKQYLKNGQKQHCFHTIGAGALGPVVVCEGYATGDSIHQATGYQVYVSFDASNLKHVAKLARGFHADRMIIIAGDDDVFSAKNAGREAANEAAKLVNGKAVFPVFSSLEGEPSDFNDLHAREGLELVQNQLMEQKTPVIEPVESVRSVDYYTPLMITNSKGKPRAVLENLKEIADRLGYEIRYNVIKKSSEIIIPNENYNDDNAANIAGAKLESECAKFDFPVGNLGSFITYLAAKNQFNPVRAWIESKPWDGVSRLNDFFDTVTPRQCLKMNDGSMFHHHLIKTWMVSAVHAALSENGGGSRGVLVFQGGQLLGKTAWFKSLIPADFGLRMDSFILNSSDKDSIIDAISNWLVELGEVDATFKKSDTAALKAFISRSDDTLRLPYAKSSSNFKRRTVFFASVNPKAFLHDSTGNTRYWVIECEKINYAHGMDMQQVWAEIYQLWRNGADSMLSDEAVNILNDNNENHAAVEPIKELLQSRLLWNDAPENWVWRTATEIAQSIGITAPKKSDTNMISQFARDLNGGKDKRSNGRRLLFVPKAAENYYQY